MAKDNKVKVKLTVRMCDSFNKGVPHYIESGETVTRNPDAAAKMVRQGLGTIVADAAPIELGAQ